MGISADAAIEEQGPVSGPPGPPCPERRRPVVAGTSLALVDRGTPRPGDGRPVVDGKFLAVGGRRLWLHGVSYGTFATDDDGYEVGDRSTVEADFEAMVRVGINAVRVYSMPPRWLLDVAFEHGLWVMVGLAWQQHVTFLDDRAMAADIVAGARAEVATCAGHPALLCFAIGNEIPASIVRWHGRRIERFLRRLYAAVKSEDPGALVTYVNFPSTEYLHLPFLDFVAVNVYLEQEEALGPYLARLQNEAGERPLVLAELGLDSRRNGLDRQATELAAQIRRSARTGCAGTFVFSWTDEWHRADTEVLDWDFGLTDRRRRPKPALAWVAAAFAQWSESGSQPPRFSVVVCTHNGAATLDECLRGATSLDYPDYEVIVVDDGSTDSSAEIAANHRVRLLTTTNEGLSAARNHGSANADGEIVAYLDDDAVPDPDWLRFLAIAFEEDGHAAVGGPNLAVSGDGDVAACVANAPGGPQHVLLSDSVAEHIPGCNMAFRRDTLAQIGGFDERFRQAGDDVDICWRLQQHGETIGFHPTAVVWHHRRRTLRAFLRQQRGYGRAEALLERKWPEKYNAAGHLTWLGRLYGRSDMPRLSRSRIYYGVWGTGAFQQRTASRRAPLLAYAGAPEWYLIILILAALAAVAAAWPPLLVAVPILGLTLAMASAHAIAGGFHANFHGLVAGDAAPLRLLALTASLHVLQPIARLHGRLGAGLSPWRRARIEPGGLMLPRRQVSAWSESWEPLEQRIARLEGLLRGSGLLVRRAGAFARWELQAATGTIGAARVRIAVEDHGAGRQLLRARVWPWLPHWLRLLVPALLVLAALAARDGAWPVAAMFAATAAPLAIGAVYECLRAITLIQRSASTLASTPAEQPRAEDAGGTRPLAPQRAARGDHAGRDRDQPMAAASVRS